MKTNEYKTGVLVSKLIESLGLVLALLLVWGVAQPGQVEQIKEIGQAVIPMVAAVIAWLDRKGVEDQQRGESQ